MHLSCVLFTIDLSLVVLGVLLGEQHLLHHRFPVWVLGLRRPADRLRLLVVIASHTCRVGAVVNDRADHSLLVQIAPNYGMDFHGLTHIFRIEVGCDPILAVREFCFHALELDRGRIWALRPDLNFRSRLLIMCPKPQDLDHFLLL